VIFKVIQGHWQWCHPIGYIQFPVSLPLQVCLYLAPFPIILSLISQNLKRSRDFEHIPFGSNISCMHSYSSVSISTRNLKCLVSLITKIWLGQNKKRSRDPYHAPFRGGLSLQARIWYSLSACKFDDSSISRSRYIIGGGQNLKWVTWP